jgi:ABC-type enterobactin transport system permease subunit
MSTMIVISGTAADAFMIGSALGVHRVVWSLVRGNVLGSFDYLGNEIGD